MRLASVHIVIYDSLDVECMTWTFGVYVCIFMFIYLSELGVLRSWSGKNF